MNGRGALSAPLIAVATASAILASTLALAGYMERNVIPLSSQQTSRVQTLDGQLVTRGRSLFLMNCAHCHADDATGDEGPDLHGLRKTDARLRLLISDGIKGEMPRFAVKLAPGDLDALVAYLDSLRWTAKSRSDCPRKCGTLLFNLQLHEAQTSPIALRRSGRELRGVFVAENANSLLELLDLERLL